MCLYVLGEGRLFIILIAIVKHKTSCILSTNGGLRFTQNCITKEISRM
jgi:hypothetical protein